MSTITVRDRTTGKLLAFGPDNGMYSPGIPPGAVKAVEPDYTEVYAEWSAGQPPPIDRDAAKAQLRNAKSLTDVINALQNLL